MSDNSEENKKPNLVLIVLIVFIIIIAFVFTFGNYAPKVEHVKPIYDDIDFNKINENIELEIKSRNEKLEYIRSNKALLLKEINKSINWLKGSIAIIWILINGAMYFCCNGKYTINEFIQFNEATIIVLVFILFMISEKFTSLHLAFDSLKKMIVKKITYEFDVSSQIEEKLKKELYLLEAIYYTHPSIIQLKK